MQELVRDLRRLLVERRKTSREGIVDDLAGLTEESDDRQKKIYIEHGTRSDTVEKKFTLSVSTVEALEQLFADSDKAISNIERSKIIDVVIGDKIKVIAF